MNNSSFKFKIVDIAYYKKGNDEKARIVCYCSYGFLITLYTSKQNAEKLVNKSKQPGFDMTDYISVIYNNESNTFSYFLITEKI